MRRTRRKSRRRRRTIRKSRRRRRTRRKSRRRRSRKKSFKFGFTEKIVIYALKNCPACDKAKQLVKENNVPCLIKDITKHRDYVQEKSGGYRYAPAIFSFDGTFMGGNQELEEYIDKCHYLIILWLETR